MEYEEFKSIFEEKEKKINLNVSDDNINKLYIYMKILLDWNENINLTAITEQNEIIEKHFIDSLTVLKYVEGNKKIIDVGTGAGFPGIPLAINCNSNITLVDSLNKRIKFLEEVKERLGLTNIKNIHGRAEEVARQKEYREMYDIAVSRAVAPMNVLLEYLLPFVKVGGLCLCMKGPNAIEELEMAKNAINMLGGEFIEKENIKLGDGDIERNLIIIKKVKNISNRYPRKPGMPTKQPL